MIFLRFGEFTTTKAAQFRVMGLSNVTEAFVWFTSLVPPEIYQVKDGGILSARRDLEDGLAFGPCKIAEITPGDLIFLEHCQVNAPSVGATQVLKFVKVKEAK